MELDKRPLKRGKDGRMYGVGEQELVFLERAPRGTALPEDRIDLVFEETCDLAEQNPDTSFHFIATIYTPFVKA